MMQVSTIRSAMDAQSPTISSGGSSPLSFDTFLRLLTVQLATQNPLEPMNDRDFFAQMAQLGQVQGMEGLRDAIQMTQASSLIGKTVTAFRSMADGAEAGNEQVTGKVQGVSLRQNQYYLSVLLADDTTVDVRLSAVRQVKE
jgi:flagellar basal-body rod modification protein FlgD